MFIPFKKAKAFHLRLGDAGENTAAMLLESKHCEILCRNFKCDNGEIDIVARDGALLVFVEVKTRRADSSSRPATGLLPNQKARIYNAAMTYYRKIGRPATPFRFDLIEVIFLGRSLKELRHWENHITAEEIKIYKTMKRRKDSF